jgi:hypothetical protein
MLKLVEQKKKYEHDYGELFQGEKELVPFIREYKRDEDITGYNPIGLTYFSYNPFTAIKRAYGVEDAAELVKLFNSSKYTCAITEREFHALIPLYILSKDNSDLKCDEVRPHLIDMIKDTSWNQSQFMYDTIKKEGWEPSRIENLFLGSGYDMGFLPSDGCNSFLDFVIELSNGDLVVCKGIVWHNK